MTPKALFTTGLLSMAFIYVAIFLLVFMQVRWEIKKRPDGETHVQRRKRLRYAGLVLIFSTIPIANILIPVYFICLMIYMMLRHLYREIKKVASELRKHW